VIHVDARGMMRKGTGSDKRGAALKPSAPAAPVRAAPQRAVRGAALWAAVGFVCGAITWHTIGFWQFMSRLMFDDANNAVTVEAPVLNGSEIETGSLPTIVNVDHKTCITLMLDRSSNQTAARPCPREGLALRLEPDVGREDLAVIADSGLR
jgi:hypothetical protein